MQTKHAQTIVLNRINYAEADKIVTLLCSDGKKISAIAKGVRKPKSRLTAGVELFCVCDVSYIYGKSGLATLTGAKVKKQYVSFLANYLTVQYAFDVIKAVNSLTEQNAGATHYNVLTDLYVGLESNFVELEVLWAWVKLLNLHGRDLQLNQQTNGQAFTNNSLYMFNAESAGFVASNSGSFTPEHIKLLKLLYKYPPSKLANIVNANKFAQDLIAPIKQFTLSEK